MAWGLMVWVLMVLGCGQEPPSAPSATPEGVFIHQVDGHYRLVKDGVPLYLQGACVLGTEHMAALAAAGGNAIRTYPGDDLPQIFSVADSLGLGVVLALDLPPARYGFDYRNPAQRAHIRAAIKAQVLAYKDEPSLLLWGIGNEVHIMAEAQQEAIYAFVDSLSRDIHAWDGRHPTTYMVNGPEAALDLYRHCPDLDIISINTFGSLHQLDKVLGSFGWAISKPILISEWGPIGYWATPTSEWGAPLEMNSSEKGKAYAEQYTSFLSPDHPLLLGSCLFFWDYKHEQTPTWFSLFTEAGEATNVVDEMTQVWTGKAPANRAPHFAEIHLEGEYPGHGPYLYAGATYSASLDVSDPDGDSLYTQWEISPEFKREGITGGDREQRPPRMPELILEAEAKTLRFQAPEASGPYRLFVYVRDGKGKVATANLPFFVQKTPRLHEPLHP